MSTKDFSSVQEKCVADYLNWKVVTGSGSRDFHPGDIISDDWLGECKTHITRTDSIVFYRRHWDKIAKESFEINKYPALFTDDGSQSVDKTWVLFDPVRIQPDDCIISPISININKNLKFKHRDMLSQYKSIRSQNLDVDFCILSVDFGDICLGLVPLSIFREMFSWR